MPTWIGGFLFSLPFIIGIPLTGFVLVNWIWYTVQARKKRRK